MGFDPLGALAGLAGGIGGFFVGGPLGAAVGSGLGTTLATGDISKGLMAGALGYGLGGAAGMLGDIGAEGVSAAAGAAGEGLGATAGGMGEMGAQVAATQGLSGAGAANLAEQGASNVATGAGGMGVSGAPHSFLTGIGDKLDLVSRGAQTDGALKKVFVDNAMKTTLPILAGGYGMMSDSGTGYNSPPPAQQWNYNRTTTPYNRQVNMPPASYRPGVDPEWRYFDGGGGVGGGGASSGVRRLAESHRYAEGGGIQGLPMPTQGTHLSDDDPYPPERVKGGQKMKIREAEQELEDFKPRLDKGAETPSPFVQYRNPTFRFADGGGIAGQPVQGPGDGLSDSIPTTINGQQPAALSDGEYVVPARVVSALGNGSTKAGIRALDNMVSQTMQHTYGQEDPSAKPVDPNQMMPASFKSGGPVSRYGAAIAKIETGGHPNGGYGVVGPATGEDRPYGRYQVMGSNVGPWTQEALGKRLTPSEFLASPDAQDTVFNHKFGQSIQQYGTPEDAASVWFSGRPINKAGNAKDVLGTSVPSYVKQFRQNLGDDAPAIDYQEADPEVPASEPMPVAMPAAISPTPTARRGMDGYDTAALGLRMLYNNGGR